MIFRTWLFLILGSAIAWVALAMAWQTRDRLPVPDIMLARALPEGTLRVVMFGTSLTAPPQIWPEALARTLQDCRGAPVKLVRVAGPGQNVAWGLAHLPEVVAARPDLVLIEFAINDASLWRGMRSARATALHVWLIAELQAALPEAQVVLMTMSPAYGARWLIRPWLARHYAAYAPLAQAMGTGFIDLHARWQALPRAAQGLELDGLHPDPDTAASVIVPGLIDYLGCPMPL